MSLCISSLSLYPQLSFKCFGLRCSLEVLKIVRQCTAHCMENTPFFQLWVEWSTSRIFITVPHKEVIGDPTLYFIRALHWLFLTTTRTHWREEERERGREDIDAVLLTTEGGVWVDVFRTNVVGTHNLLRHALKLKALKYSSSHSTPHRRVTSFHFSRFGVDTLLSLSLCVCVCVYVCVCVCMCVCVCVCVCVWRRFVHLSTVDVYGTLRKGEMKWGEVRRGEERRGAVMYSLSLSLFI
jgi:hypothetical protein